MALCRIISKDEDALICDFAEVYNIYDYRALPLKYAAVLFFGLRADSRSHMALQDMTVTLEQMLMAMTVDSLNLLVWFQSEDGQKGRNRPKSILDILQGKEKITKHNDILSFSSAEAFERERERRINGN